MEIFYVGVEIFLTGVDDVMISVPNEMALWTGTVTEPYSLLNYLIELVVLSINTFC